MKTFALFALVAMSVALASCVGTDGSVERHLPVSYPHTATCAAADTLWGDVLPDPYRWLFTDTVATRSWAREQNELTQRFLADIPYHDAVQHRLYDLHHYERMSLVRRFGNWYFFSLNNSLSDQELIYVQESLNRPRRVFFDPNQPYHGKHLVLKYYECSADGRWMAMYVNFVGEPTDAVLVWDVREGRELKDQRIEGLKYSRLCWAGNGFYYGRHDATGPRSIAEGAAQQIYYHTMGTSPSEDTLVVDAMPGRSWNYKLASMGPDQRYLFLMPGIAGGNALYVLDRQQEHPKPILMSDHEDTYNLPIGIVGDSVYIYSNYHTLRGRVLRASLQSPELRLWQQVVEPTDYWLVGVNAADHHLLLTYLIDGHHEAYLTDLEGRNRCRLDIPNYASVTFQSDMESREIFYTAQSFAMPTAVHKYDMKTNSSVPYITPTSDMHPDDYLTELVLVPSVHGKSVPLYITRRRNMPLDGRAPCVMVGYGGFGRNITPSFNMRRMVLLEQGCVIAQVCARGGQEYGSTWHRDGMLMQKENTFSDFQAAMTYLCDHGYTSADRLGLQASGIGALAIAVIANRAPHSFAVGVGIEPHLDMLHLQQWGPREAKRVRETGSPLDSLAMYRYLRNYDPISNIRPGQYPAILMTTAIDDDFISPAHAYKYIAALQNSETGDEPKLLQVKEGDHHRKFAETVDEYAAFCSFFFYNIGIPYRPINTK